MPSNTFYRLSEEKKKKLTDAAIEEFSSVSYSEASINTIIAKAEISRGSFYMYFEDKEDLFKYLLSQHKEIFDQITRESFEANNGDLFEGFKMLFRKVNDYLHQPDNQKFLKQVLLNMNSKQEDFIIPHRPHLHQKEHFTEILKLVNIKNLNVESEDDLIAALDIIMPITVHTLVMVVMHELPNDEANRIYLQKLKLLKEGIERREVC